MKYTIESLYGIKDKVIVVTGGTGGMGSFFSKAFVELGAKVAVLDVNQEKIDAQVEEIKAENPGADIIGLTVDIANEESVATVFEKIYNHFGSIWGLINFAGITYVENLRNLDVDRWQRVMDINARGTLLADKYAAKYMFKNKAGRILNVSSPAAITGKPGYTPYTASKGAVDGITRVLAIEWGRRNITVNALYPLGIVSVMTKEQWGDRIDEFVQMMQKSNIQGKVPQVEYMLGLVVFIFSESSHYINGQFLKTDGGASAGFYNDYFPQDNYEDEE